MKIDERSLMPKEREEWSRSLSNCPKCVINISPWPFSMYKSKNSSNTVVHTILMHRLQLNWRMVILLSSWLYNAFLIVTIILSVLRFLDRRKINKVRTINLFGLKANPKKKMMMMKTALMTMDQCKPQPSILSNSFKIQVSWVTFSYMKIQKRRERKSSKELVGKSRNNCARRKRKIIKLKPKSLKRSTLTNWSVLI